MRASLLVLTIALLSAGCFGNSGALPTPTPQLASSALIERAAGGSVALPDGTRLSLPPNALQADARISLNRMSAGTAPSPAAFALRLGEPLEVDLQGQTLGAPAILEIPYDSTLLPAATSEQQIFVSYFDEGIDQWIPVGGVVDPVRHVVAVETTHASFWEVDAWLKDALVLAIVASFKLDFGAVLDARQAFGGCLEGYSKVVFDESESHDLIAACVELDDFDKPRVRVINRKAHHVAIRAAAGTVGTDLSPAVEPIDGLDFVSFAADFTGRPPRDPLTIQAQVDWPYTIGYALLDLIDVIPGVKGALNKDVRLRIMAEIKKNEHVIGAVEAITASDNQRFREEIILAMSDANLIEHIGEILLENAPKGSMLSKVDAKFLTGLMKALSGTAVVTEIVQAANSTYKGAGLIRFYSNRILPRTTSRVWLYALEERGLWRHDLASNQSEPVTYLPTGFIGSSLDGQGRRVMYLTWPGAQTESDVTYQIYRVLVDETAGFDLVLQITKPAFHLQYYLPDGDTPARLSPDGSKIAYGDLTGAHVYDLETGQNKLLAQSKACTSTDIDCYAYGDPQWSPDGERIVFLRTLYEGSYNVFFDLGISSPAESRMDVDGARWSADGQRLCGRQPRLDGGGLRIVSSDGALLQDLSAPFAASGGQYLTGCTWVSESVVAASHTANGATHVTFISTEGTLLRDVPIPGSASAQLLGVHPIDGRVIATLLDRAAGHRVVFVDQDASVIQYSAGVAVGVID